uniref:Uncharacterized protein MANES_08G120300 n=1 Tax=Rhizophora mucronata TaxID=61149 RepID=A0A2P2IT92_RHIMU
MATIIAGHRANKVLQHPFFLASRVWIGEF